MRQRTLDRCPTGHRPTTPPRRRDPGAAGGPPAATAWGPGGCGCAHGPLRRQRQGHRPDAAPGSHHLHHWPDQERASAGPGPGGGGGTGANRPGSARGPAARPAKPHPAGAGRAGFGRTAQATPGSGRQQISAGPTAAGGRQRGLPGSRQPGPGRGQQQRLRQPAGCLARLPGSRPLAATPPRGAGPELPLRWPGQPAPGSAHRAQPPAA